MSGRHLPTIVAALVAAVATTWPMVLHPVDRALGDPTIEAVDHLWTLWAATRDGPLVIHTNLLRYPDGYSWVLGDPLDLLWYAPGLWLGGPVMAFNLVHFANLLLAGLAAVVAGRVFLGERAGPDALAAVLAIVAAPMAGGIFTGMTEAQTMAWAVLALAALDRALVAGGWRRIALAGALLGACAWAGPYVALYAALAAPVLVLLRTRDLRAPLRAAAAATIGGLGALPVIQAIAGRASGLPGSEALTSAVLSDPDLGKYRMMGADLLHLVLPLESSVGADQHTVYLGLLTFILGTVAFAGWRRGGAQPRPWVLLALVLTFGTLSLGVYLQAGGGVPRVSGRVLLLPAGFLSLAIEAVGRATRWYRAAMPAVILLSALAASGAALLTTRLAPRLRLPLLAALGLVAAADALWVAPISWPRPTFAATLPEGYARLLQPGPLVEVPPIFFANDTPTTQRRGGDTVGPDDASYRVSDALPIRHVALLWQTFHGRPLGGNPHQAEDKAERTEASRAAERLNRAARSPTSQSPTAPIQAEKAREALRDAGFAYIIHHPVASMPERTDGFRRLLGEPEVDTPDLMAWRP